MAVYDVTVHEINVWNRSVVADSKQEACDKVEDTIAKEGFEYCELTMDRIKSRAKQLPVLTYDQFLQAYHDKATDLFRSVAVNELGGWVARHIMLDIELLEDAYPQYYIQVKDSGMLAENCWKLIEECRSLNKKPLDLVSDQLS